ncbi:cytochrome P450 [Sorangium sp. So ce134]
MRAPPPGPDLPRPLFLYHWFYRTYPFLEECARRYGEAFSIRIPGMRQAVVLHHPDAIKEVITAGTDDAHAGKLSTNMAPLLGKHSLLLLDGAEHLRQRKLLLPPLHGERMNAYGARIAEITESSLARWPVGREFPVHERLQAITLDVILRVVFGLDDPSLLESVRARLLRLLDVGSNPWLLVPALQRDLGAWSPWGRFVRAIRGADELLYAEIGHRRAQGRSERDDVLTLLLQARDEQGQGMTDQELRDELTTLLVTGNETTATSLAWALRWILATPAVHERLQQELAEGDASPERLVKLPYLDATVREVLRMQPVFPLIGRVVQRPMRIGGLDFEEGDGVILAFYLTHRRPELYAEPRRFHPERFLERKYGPTEWLPFGGGARRCIGMALALYEMKIVLGTVLSRASLRLARDRVREVRRSLTIAPSDGLPVILERQRQRGPRPGASN